jgi:hypothetical protein
MNELDALRSIGADEALTSSQVFDAIFAAGSILNDNDREAESALEIAIRLLEARRNGQMPKDCVDAVEYLAEECGLYPYINIERFSYLTQTIIEAHAVQLDEKLYLHSKQMQILLWLLDGDSVVLSAPTSFGKSLLVDAFLASKRPHTVLVILPTQLPTAIFGAPIGGEAPDFRAPLPGSPISESMSSWNGLICSA